MGEASQRMGGWYWLGYNLSKLTAKILFRLRVEGRHHLIEDGPALLAANHQSFLDPPFVGICCTGPCYFLARKSLLEWPLLGPIFPKINVVPVDQDRADMSALKAVIRLMKEGKRAVLFPEGSRTVDGCLQPAQPGIGLIVAKARVPVIPVRIWGAFEAFPRKAKLPRLHPITIRIGKPLRYDRVQLPSGAPREVYQQIADEIISSIAALPEGR